MATSSPGSYAAQLQKRQSLTATPDNFLFVEPLILDFLKKSLDDLTTKLNFLTAPELSTTTEKNQPVPAVHLIYEGYAVSTDTARQPVGKSVVLINQTWSVTVCVRNVRDIKSGSDARQMGGNLAARVMKSLMGWQPDGCTKPLKLVNAARAIYSEGYMYIPIGFEVEFILRSENANY